MSAIQTDHRQLLSDAAQIKVFFNHQSVGDNILSGVEGLGRNGGGAWSVVKLSRGPWPSDPGIWHAMLGENEKPRTKIDAFAEALRTWPGNKPQVAMLKLCFVDVDAKTDISELLAYYYGIMNQLKGEFPSVVFGHVTVPLAPPPYSLKAEVKRLIGREVTEDAANLARTNYNRQLRQSFPSDPILDLEEVESKRADGSRVVQSVKGMPAYGLAPDLAGDAWGHLNEQGSRLAAIALARFIVDAAAKKQAAP